MTTDILGIGSPILDYIIEVDNAFIESLVGKKGGMEPVDEATFNLLLKKAIKEPLIKVGGSCSNVIRGLSSLGYSCALLGVIGQDNVGQFYQEDMQKRKIKPLFQKSTLPSSKVLSFVTPDGQRTCRSFLGASQNIQLDLIKPDLLENVKLVHIEGYSLLQGQLPEHVMPLAQKAHAKISFDLASFEIVESHRERILNLLKKYVTICFANEDEIQSLTGFGGQKGCLKLAELVSVAVVMQNKEGCFVAENENVIQIKPTPVKALDTTGAGDLFAAGFLAAYLKKLPLKKCAESGNFLGGAAVQVFGTELSAHTYQKAQNFLTTL